MLFNFKQKRLSNPNIYIALNTQKSTRRTKDRLNIFKKKTSRIRIALTVSRVSHVWVTFKKKYIYIGLRQ